MSAALEELHGEMLGHEVSWVAPDGEEVTGRCIGVRDPGSTFRNMKSGEEHHAVQFLIATGPGGSRWTTSFPDHLRPLGGQP